MQCPISEVKIDEHRARLVALFVAGTTGFALATPSPLPELLFGLLVLDFSARSFGRRAWSPLGRSAAGVAKLLKVSSKPVDAAPKLFAARIGLVFSLSLLGLSSLDNVVALRIVASLLIVCALLEALAGTCVGCKVWTLWQWALLRSRPTPSARRS